MPYPAKTTLPAMGPVCEKLKGTNSPGHCSVVALPFSVNWNRLALPRAASVVTGKGCRRSEEHTSELQSLRHLVCRLLLEKKKNRNNSHSAMDVSMYTASSAMISYKS